MATMVSLPDWAKRREALKGRIPGVDVDADAMYPALLAELKEHYAERTPPEWSDAEGKLKPEWEKCLAELEEPTAYWLEVAYQCMKMDLQIAMRTFAFEIHVHDAKKAWAQKKHKPGRGVAKAAGGSLIGKGGKEAREHYKRLRGFIPG